MNYLRNQNGIALIVTLLALALITAMVVEFAYGVYTGTNNLYNWRDSQRLSLMARSGVNVSARLLSDMLNGLDTYSYPGLIELPVENPFEDFNGTIVVRIEDETSKFNVNSLVSSGEVFNGTAYKSFQRLLKILSLDEKIADRVRDWIDKDNVAELPDSEQNAKNSALLSVDELLLINGISKEDYDKLLPYVTVHGTRDNLFININGAEKPVLQCLSDEITEELAQRVIEYRKVNPFENITQMQKVAGVTSMIYNPISSMITVKGTHFSINSSAASEGVKRIIMIVLNTSASSAKIEYWKEY